MRRAGTAVVVSLLVTACALGPDYKSPDPDLSEGFLHAGDTANAQKPINWWLSFEDETLLELLRRSLDQSPSIRAARADLDAAFAARRLARAAFWPDLVQNASYTRFEQSLTAPNAIGPLVDAGLVERDGEFYTTSLDTRWELDLWGGLRRDNERAAAELAAAGATYRAIELAQLAETAAAYFEYLGSTARLVQLDKNLELLSESKVLTRKRQKIGLGRELDALRAEVALANAAAQKPTVQTAQRASLYRLAVLTGQRPDQIVEKIQPRALPKPLTNLAPGTPADLLQRRPDLIIAERRLAAATAAVGVARAQYFPSLTLNASYGFESIAFDDIGESPARNTGIVPFIRWPVFAGGRIRAEVASANARVVAEAARYEDAVLSSLAETETALFDYQNTLESNAQLRTAAVSAARAAGIARQLYTGGLLDYLAVLDAERTLTQVEDQYVVARTQSLLALVQLYKSLGGGWPEPENELAPKPVSSAGAR